MEELVGILKSLVPATGIGGFLALIGYIIQSRVKSRQNEISGETALRADMKQMIAELRRELETSEAQCLKDNRLLTGRVNLLGRALISVAGDLEKFDASLPSVVFSKKALEQAFPLEFTPDAEITRLLNEIARKG